MKINNIFKAAAAALVALVTFAGCSREEFDEITDLNLARCLEPQNLSVKVNVASGDVVTFSWDVNKDAENFNLVVYTDAAMSAEAMNVTIGASEVPYTVRMTADQTYYFKVQALATGKGPSTWAVYDGSCKTYAVKDNLFLEVKARTSSSISLSWSKDAADYTEVTHILASPVKGGESVTLELGSAEAEAAAATVTGLTPSTEYQFTLFYMSASRGSVDTWTPAEAGSATTVSSAADLKANMIAGGDIYLTLAGSPYEISDIEPLGSIKPTSSVKLMGEIGADGSTPVVVGKIELTSDLASGSSMYFEGITFDGGAANSRVIEHTSGTLEVESIKFVNCTITNFLAGLFYGNANDVIHVGDFTFDSCDIFGILGSGGDAFDVRKTTEIDALTFTNNTIYDGIRTMFRIDASDAIKVGSVDFENNTVKNIATMDDGNNRGFFAFRVPTEMTLKKNIFLWEDGGKDESDRAQLFQVNANTVIPTLTASDNFSFAEGVSFFEKVTAAEAGFTILDTDPCYNSKGGFFQLDASSAPAAKKAGASKWWIEYVEKDEDLTQGVITSAHTWNLQDASLFAGDVKNSRVRDELMLVGTEATPLNADGGITFLSEAVLTRKGVPTEGYISFKVDKEGSVDILVSDPDKNGSSLVVALNDYNGFNVVGGAVASASNPEVQKIVVKPVSGEGTIYIYPTGPISITKLAWSEDVIAGNKVLSTPKLTVDPVTVKEGDETEVRVSWAAVDNAASYELKFNKKVAELEEGALEYTVPAETIAALEAGLYNFSIVALPADGDIYYEKSQEGYASVAVQPKGGSDEPEPEVKTIVWDFTSEYSSAINVSDTQVYLYDAGTVTATTTYAENQLYFSPNGKAVKHSPKASNADGITYQPITYGGGAAYMFIHTSKAGKLKVTATVGKSVIETGNCKLGVKIGDNVIGENVDLECFDQDKAGLGAVTYEWDITNESGAAQDIQIVKPGGSNSPFIYEVVFVAK